MSRDTDQEFYWMTWSCDFFKALFRGGSSQLKLLKTEYCVEQPTTLNSEFNMILMISFLRYSLLCNVYLHLNKLETKILVNVLSSNRFNQPSTNHVQDVRNYNESLHSVLLLRTRLRNEEFKRFWFLLLSRDQFVFLFIGYKIRTLFHLGKYMTAHIPVWG